MFKIPKSASNQLVELRFLILLSICNQYVSFGKHCTVEHENLCKVMSKISKT